MGKGKIIVPARLEICPICQLHGKIVYSDESRSERLGSHEEALAELERARQAGLLIPIEITELRKQIDDYLLPQEIASSLRAAATLLVVELSEPSEADEDSEAQAEPQHGRAIPICNN